MENIQKQIPVSKGTKIMLDTVQNELLPLVDKLRELLVRVRGFRIKFYLYSPTMAEFQKEYSDLSVKFFDVSKKLETPDILFKELEPNPQDIASYFQFQNAISKNINDGANYIEIIDRTLDRKNESIQNARTTTLALIAILISIITSNN